MVSRSAFAAIAPAFCSRSYPSHPFGFPKGLKVMAMPTSLWPQWGCGTLEVADGVENTPPAPCVHFAPCTSLLLSFTLTDFLNLRSLVIVLMFYAAFYSMSASCLESPLG